MKIVNPKYEILYVGATPDEALEMIKVAGTTCYQSYEWTKKTAAEFVKGLMDRNHLAMIEFGPSITVRFTVDRGVTHEIVRHRLFSFAQESTRYVNYNKAKGSYDGEIQFINPCFWKYQSGNTPEDISKYNESYAVWKAHMENCESTYKQLCELGAKPEEARSVLPNSLKAEIVVKGNLREWIHFFKMRTDVAAHPQMREVARPLLEEFKKLIPVVFDNIKY